MPFNTTESVTEEILKRLGNHLASNMPELEEVLDGFPEGNTSINFPSLSIIEAGTSKFTNEMSPYPYVEIEASDITDHKADVRYVVGQYDVSLQLDFWCRSKEERDDLFEKFIQAFNSQFPSLGLNLVLTDYHNVMCYYMMEGYSKEDSEISSQRQEWRVKINIVANCKAILEKEEPIVEETEVTGDIQGTSEPI